VPNQIYFNMNAIENVRQFPSRSTIIVTNPALEHIGHVDIVRRGLSNPLGLTCCDSAICKECFGV